MPSLIIVVGMPGSGKTTYLKWLKENKKVDTVIDDYQKDPVDGNYADPIKSQHSKRLVNALRSGKRTAIADRRYCLDEELKKIVAMVSSEAPEATIEIHSFENNYTACKANILSRNRAGYVESEIAFLDEHHRDYRPSGDKILAVKTNKPQ